ncbi:MAG: glycosyltransferase family 2 protein [Pseudomonadota bacterium]|nr:glycosyltransferase family 2 protein [Pseudomonadota bacterium]
MSSISIIIPVLDEARLLPATLGALQDVRQRGHEVLVVDGGSRDGSMTIARKFADRVLMSGPVRAQRMDAGADSARHDILLFLHADSVLPANADALVIAALAVPGQIWGHFDLGHGGAQFPSRMHAMLATWRSLFTGLARGSQAIFVERTWFERVGGYGAVSDGEDLALSRKLKRHAWPARIAAPVVGHEGE